MKLDDLIHDCTQILRAEHYSYRTEQCYLGWVRRFFRFSLPRRELPLQERVNQFLGDMAPNCAVATQLQALNALAFLCNRVLDKPVDFGDYAQAERPKRLPVWLSRDEVQRLFANMRGTTLTMAANFVDEIMAVFSGCSWTDIAV